MRQTEIIRYSISFKQQIIKELETGRFSSISEAKQHYGINGADTIQRWLGRYGRNHLCPRIVRVEMPNEKDQIRQLKNQIKQLQQVLGQTQAEKAINEAFLEIACQQLGQDVEQFKKKADSRLSEGQGEQCRQ
jgi:transposase